MPISGDTKENYIGLQQSTGERFSSMADRILAPDVLDKLDNVGRDGNRELAAWLNSQVDDEDRIRELTMTPQDRDAQREQAAKDRSAALPSKTSAPADRKAASDSKSTT